MVKNTKGGSGHKKISRKQVIATTEKRALRLPVFGEEHIGIVTKMFGGRICQVYLVDGNLYRCHIRNKFSGKHKSGNYISTGVIVLVGKRSYESESSLNVDLEYVYGSEEVSQLQTIPQYEIYKLQKIVTEQNMNSASKTTDLIQFTTEEEDMEILNEYKKEEKNPLNQSGKLGVKKAMEVLETIVDNENLETAELNFDDI